MLREIAFLGPCYHRFLAYGGRHIVFFVFALGHRHLEL